MSLESAALKSLDQIAALSADCRALRSQLAEREAEVANDWRADYERVLAQRKELDGEMVALRAEVERLRKAGDALARSVEQPPSTRPDDLAQTLATGHTATGGTTDG